jgi:outer membrane protein OmpA-like peptidoglycan-associated protein
MMNKTTVTPFLYGPVPALLLALLLISGCCGVLPREIRYDTHTIKYTSPQDGIKSTSGPYDAKTTRYRSSNDGVTSTSGQYEDATAYYISRDGGRVPQSPVMRATSQHKLQLNQNQEQPAKDLPMVIEVSDVLFDFDKWVIKTPFYPVLDQWVEYLKNNPLVTAHIFGHADSTGPTAYNQTLSEKRAQSVINYLVAKGISPDRLTARGFGESQPVAPNSTREGRQKNRRVELNF